MSLEENRAHLRRQLISKESEINRLSVQTKVTWIAGFLLLNFSIIINFVSLGLGTQA